MDYRLRHISAAQRVVVKSNLFPIAGLSAGTEAALADLQARFETGGDVNPFLSKTTVTNDVSGAKRVRRTDGLWADWKIHHFHLSSEPMAAGARFSKRSDWLLFAMVYDDAVAFIDVRSHGEDDLWTQTDLLGTFIDSWPQQAEPFRVSAMRLDSRPMTPKEHAEFRAIGLNMPVEHKGEHYLAPGGGITSALSSAAASTESLAVKHQAGVVARWLDLPDNHIRLEVQSSGIAKPKFFLGPSDQGLCIVEKTDGEKPWLLPRADAQSGVEGSALSRLHDLFLPEWAVAPLMQYWRANP